MYKIFKQINLIFFLILAVPALAYASYTITPVVLNIKRGVMVSSLSITNNNDDSTYFQLGIFETDENKHTLEKETKDIISAPSMFKINGKKSQIIRIAVKNSEAVFKHKYYILSIKELVGPFKQQVQQ